MIESNRNGNKTMSSTEILKNLSEMDFLALGSGEIAYMTSVTVDGEEAIEIKSADGKSLSIIDNEDLAFAIANQQDLKLLVRH